MAEEANRLEELKDFKRVKGKYKISTLNKKDNNILRGTLNNGDYFLTLYIENNYVIASISETEYGVTDRENLRILFFIVPPKKIKVFTNNLDENLIREILDRLEWEYSEEQIWIQ